MKPYGLNKKQIADSDDVVGIRDYARKPSVGYFPNKSGKCRARIKGSLKRKSIRRLYKKQERNNGKNIILKFTPIT